MALGENAERCNLLHTTPTDVRELSRSEVAQYKVLRIVKEGACALFGGKGLPHSHK